MVGAGAGAETCCLSRVWGLFLLSAFPAHDSTQGWACRFLVAAWESQATWRAGRSPRPHHLVPSDSCSGAQGARDACELSTPQTTQSSRFSQEQSCCLHGEDETRKRGTPSSILVPPAGWAQEWVPGCNAAHEGK